ncbi:zinc finger CCCH domain-containing protein 14 [Drosophila mojavensis]|uniref:zinc finger CCCH domain-containing protein 14 n=1 Tax=Drosophila mojavensis TaxID=7230 RepID=UPI001CD0C79F|nr:zinc finger CCCH domain-containing protein 14 [Drosophila mojavensis]
MDCNLGSEIGQKMRSAVKAKLLELGTGGSAGFIDDELPDYVMVMVANKRTKQQMNAELNLFLGDQTDLFVTWLHEVLQKLQEVTLPVPTSSSKKRKSRQAEVPKAKDKDKDKDKEKDKRAKDKRDKRAHRKSGDELLHTTGEVTPRTDPLPSISSITDVFAEELLEKAKKTLDIDGTLKDELLLKKKKRKTVEDDEQPQPQPQPQTRDIQPTSKDFDLPTMSEISSTTTSGNREKDIAELAEIQRKIYAAKQQLRQIGELDDETDEEEPQPPVDYTQSGNEPKKAVVSNTAPVAEEVNSNSGNSSTRRPKSPIVFNRTSEPVVAREKPKAQTEVEAQQKSNDEHLERRSVHERLGCKPHAPQPSDRPQRAQKEVKLYVPAHRRRSEQEPEESKKLDRSRERRERNGQTAHRRDRERETLHRRRSPSRSPKSNNYKHRIGSRVIVAVNKPPEPSDDEDLLEKPVNSVIKIKPRPHVSPRRQACKNLLLRAVADAQRSTILAKTTTTSSGSKHRGNEDEPEIISSTLGKRRSTDSAGDRPGRELFRRSRRELVVNVLHRDRKRMRPSVEPHSEVNVGAKDEVEEEEYVPSLGVGEYEAYVPQLVHNTKESDIDIDMHVDKEAVSVGCSSAALPKTQFVVTLNGDKSLGNAAAAAYRKRPRKRTPSPQVSSTSSTTLQLASVEPTSTICTATSSTNSNNRQNKAKRARSNSRSSPSTSSNTPPPKPSRSLRRSEVLRQTQEIKKIIIKNDADDDDDDEQLPASPRKRASSKRLSSTSNQAAPSSNDHKSDLKEQLEENNRSTTPPLPPKLLEKRNISREKSSNATTTNSTTVETASKAKHTPIRFKIKPEEEQQPQKKRRSGSKDRDSSIERRRISIRNAEDRKYDNLPTLSAVSVDSTVLKVAKPKERCKYHPNCNKQFCEYYHPSAPCKSFPNCKFADKCMYSHPKCKFDLACMSVDCNFAHSGPRDLSHVHLTVPPLSSHVIPVQNYKSISAPVTATTATTMCKYYPNCTKAGCTFYHPKPCRYGKNCINKLECIFYHPEMQSKFKWVASLG